MRTTIPLTNRLISDFAEGLDHLGMIVAGHDHLAAMASMAFEGVQKSSCVAFLPPRKCTRRSPADPDRAPSAEDVELVARRTKEIHS